MVSLIQTAEAMPFFLLALLAGALADIVDRRRLVLFSRHCRACDWTRYWRSGGGRRDVSLKRRFVPRGDARAVSLGTAATAELRTAEGFMGAMRAGIRYFRHAQHLQTVLVGTAREDCRKMTVILRNRDYKQRQVNITVPGPIIASRPWC